MDAKNKVKQRMPVTTHRWPNRWPDYSDGSLLNLLKPVPSYREKDGRLWDQVASWVGMVGAGLYIVHTGRHVFQNTNNKVLGLTCAAGSLVKVVVGAGVVELLSYWSVRSPLWFVGMMWLLSKAETNK